MSLTEKEMRQQFDDMFADSVPSDLEVLSIKPHGAEFYTDDVIDAFKIKGALKSKQIGGNHYINKIQPWDIIDSWGLNFYEGNILKYLLRNKDNRKEDLEKLIHYAEKLISLESNDKHQ